MRGMYWAIRADVYVAIRADGYVAIRAEWYSIWTEWVEYIDRVGRGYGPSGPNKLYQAVCRWYSDMI